MYLGIRAASGLTSSTCACVVTGLNSKSTIWMIGILSTNSIVSRDCRGVVKNFNSYRRTTFALTINTNSCPRFNFDNSQTQGRRTRMFCSYFELRVKLQWEIGRANYLRLTHTIRSNKLRSLPTRGSPYPIYGLPPFTYVRLFLVVPRFVNFYPAPIHTFAPEC